jgi:putative ABC transport system permease protein
MHSLFKDLVFGVRSLRRMPGSAIISVVVLALGIGLCSFMFSIIYGVFFRPLDFPGGDRIFAIYPTEREQNQPGGSIAIQDFPVWQARLTSFSDLIATSGEPLNVSDAGGVRRLSGQAVTANTFDVLRVFPVLGRGFAEGEDAPGSPPNVVLGHAVWRDQFGSDPNVIGRAVRVNGEAGEIIGVMPEGFMFPNNNDAWVPLREDPVALPRDEGRQVVVFGRLRDGASREQAQNEVSQVHLQIAREHAEEEITGAAVQTLPRTATGGELIIVFSAMMVAVICVLLVACANVANLLLARAALHTKEAAVRAALGGSRLRVMIPMLAEALALAIAGGLLGIGIAYVAVGWFEGMTDPARTGRPFFIRFVIDWPILGFVAGVTLFTALAAGLVPAWKVSRTNVSSVLKDEARGTSSLSIGKVTLVLVTAEVALSCLLLVGAGLMTKSILKLADIDYPFESAGVLTARVQLEEDYSTTAARELFWQELLRELEATPQIERAALTSLLPMTGAPRRRVAIDGETYANEEAMPEPNRVVVSLGYFETLGTGVTAGRDFQQLDVRGSDRVAIVNQSMVDRYLGGGNVLGRQFREGPADTLPRVTIVGVVPDLGGPLPGTDDPEPAGYFVPLAQVDPAGLNLVALPRSGAPMALAGDLRTALARVDAELPLFQVRTHAEAIDRSTWFYNVFGTVFISFGVAALFMASVGLYGVLSFAVSRRTSEMGIRMALGANAGDVMRLVIRQGVLQLAIGLVIGLGAAFGLTRLIAVMMYQVDPQDPFVFSAVLVLIVLVGVAAAIVPARRATSVDPVEALRAE